MGRHGIVHRGHGTPVLLGAIHVDDEVVCANDPAGKEGIPFISVLYWEIRSWDAMM